jgi:hypothetical protein
VRTTQTTQFYLWRRDNQPLARQEQSADHPEEPPDATSLLRLRPGLQAAKPLWMPEPGNAPATMGADGAIDGAWWGPRGQVRINAKRLAEFSDREGQNHLTSCLLYRYADTLCC